MIISLILFSSIAMASVSEEVIESIESDSRQITPSNMQHNILTKKPRNISGNNFKVKGNLSPNLIRSDFVEEIRTPLKIPKNSNYLKNTAIIPGTKLKALINSDLTAYIDSKSPVEAIVTEGEHKGSVLLGNATMDIQTKRVSIQFSSFRLRGSRQSFATTAIVRDENGDLGLNAEHESFYWHYFMAETLLNTASGLANATVERSKNAYGQYETNPNVDSAVKQGVSVGLGKSAERIGERLRTAPEYVTAKGPFVVQVLIID